MSDRDETNLPKPPPPPPLPLQRTRLPLEQIKTLEELRPEGEHVWELDVPHGFFLSKVVRKPIGYITSLKVGLRPLTPQYRVANPVLPPPRASVTSSVDTRPDLPVIAVLEQVAWALGDSDPITFVGRISAAAKMQILGEIFSSRVKVDVSIAWTLYDFDLVAGRYFASFSTSTGGLGGTPVEGRVQKDGQRLSLTVEPTAASDVDSPVNFQMMLKIVPAPRPQTLYLATGNTLRLTKQWGRAALAR